MHIDGKMITKLNQASSVTKTKKLSNQPTEQSHANIGSASDFALNQSGLDQRLRQSNDLITQLQSRQDVLKRNVDKLTDNNAGIPDGSALSEINNNIQSTGLFDGTNFEQRLNSLLASEKPLVESVQQVIKTELGELSEHISEQARQASEKTSNPDQLLQKFQTTVHTNPQTLHAAYAQLNPDIVHGLLGSSSSN